MIRLKADFKKHYRVLFGSYCKVHDEPDPSNTMEPRTHEAIALGPSGNLQGTVNFFSLDTGLVIGRWEFMCIPMPPSIVQKVEDIARKEAQGSELFFLDRNKRPFPWSTEDEVPLENPQFQGLLEDDAPYPDISAELPGQVALQDPDEPDSAVEEEQEPSDEQRAALALQNAGLQRGPDDRQVEVDQLHAPQPQAEPGPELDVEDKYPADLEMDLKDK